jgi:hypothetical protein
MHPLGPLLKLLFLVEVGGWRRKGWAVCSAPFASHLLLSVVLFWDRCCSTVVLDTRAGLWLGQYMDQNTKAGVNRAVGVELRHALGPLLGALV